MKKTISYLVMPLFFFICSCSENTETGGGTMPDTKSVELRSELQPRIAQDNALLCFDQLVNQRQTPMFSIYR